MSVHESPNGPVVPEWTLADRLVKARSVADLTQAELAEALGISNKTAIRYEAGGSTKRGIILSWAMVCNVDPNWLEHGHPSDDHDGGAVITIRESMHRDDSVTFLKVA